MTAPTTVSGDTPPPELFQLARALERWRSSAQRRRRIPEDLWTAAGRLARTYGVSRVSAALKLSYYDLQRRARGERAVRTPTPAPPTFIELPPPKASAGLGSQGMIEVVNPGGARLMLRLPEVKPEEVLALLRAFLEPRP